VNDAKAINLPLHLQGVIIDMDGVLLDTERVAEKCWRAAELETGFRMPEGFYFTLIGQAMPLIERRLIEVMDPACDIAAFLAVANRHYDHALTSEPVPVKEGAAELLAELATRNIPRCLATSTFRKLAAHKLESTGLSGYLPDRVCGDEVEHSKPAPDIYLKAAAKLGRKPSRLLAIEDSGNGLRAALDAGCVVAHVPDIAPVPLEIQTRADRIYRSLDEIRFAIDRGELLFLEPA
jgi:HAD superfamily hydrolase (TIGR01509 family)